MKAALYLYLTIKNCEDCPGQIKITLQGPRDQVLSRLLLLGWYQDGLPWVAVSVQLDGGVCHWPVHRQLATLDLCRNQLVH